MRTRSWILLAGLMVLLPTGLNGQDYAARARRWLTEAQGRLLPGYGEPIVLIEASVEEFSTGWTGSHEIVLTPEMGTEFVLLGACDDDCRAMGLYLGNEHGDHYDDDDGGDLPLVRIVRGTEIDIEVRMIRCSSEPCYYALGLYAKDPVAAEASSDRITPLPLTRDAQAIINASRPPGASEISPPTFSDGWKLISVVSGYEGIPGNHQGELAEGQYDEWTISISAGDDFGANAVCDDNCSSLHLALTGASSVSRPTAGSANAATRPMIRAETDWAFGDTSLVLRVTMTSCDAQVCEYMLTMGHR